MVQSGYEFYATRDRVLARQKSTGGPPEVFGGPRRNWTPYPGLDRQTDARPISVEQAVAMLPAGVDASALNATDDDPAGNQPLNDVSEWGEKDMSGAYPPGTTFQINGETVPVDMLPPVSSTDR